MRKISKKRASKKPEPLQVEIPDWVTEDKTKTEYELLAEPGNGPRIELTHGEYRAVKSFIAHLRYKTRLEVDGRYLRLVPDVQEVAHA